MALRAASLTGKTLLQIALGVTFVIAISSAVSYYLMFKEIQQRASEQLTQYVVQQKSEAAIFTLARDTQHVIRRALIENLPRYRNDRTLQRFDKLFIRSPDGAVRSRPETIHGTDSVTGWVHRDTPLTAELRQRIVLFYDLLEQFKPGSLVRFSDIFITSPEQLNIGTDPPGLPLWALTVPADFDQNKEEWATAASVERNPERVTAWGRLLFEPVWKKLLLAVSTPIDIGGRHIGTIHNDLLLDDIIDKLLRSDIPGAKHCLFHADGYLMAHTDKMQEISATKGQLRMQESRDPDLLALWQAVQGNPSLPISGYDEKADQYFAISRIDGPGWYFASTISGKLMRAEAFRATQWVLWAGLISLALLVGVLAVILRRQIARPLGQLTTAAERIAAGEMEIALPPRTRDELGRLAGAFNDMSRSIAERDAALREEKRDLQVALTTVRNTEERWRAMTEHVSDFIIALDAELHRKYLSPTIETILGYKPEDAALNSPLDLVHPDDAEEVQRQIEEALSASLQHRQVFRCRVRHKDGSYRHLEGVTTNLLDNPAVQGYVVNVRDTTERVKAEEEIRRQQDALHQGEKLAAMGSLLAGVAHEINNPLSVVVGRAMMLEHSATDRTTQSSAQKIRTAAERCARIVKTFLAMARQHQQQKTMVHIHEIIDASLEVLDYNLQTSGVVVEQDRGVDIPKILADADQLHQVLMNLFVNAQQAMEQSPGVRTLSVCTRFLGAEERVEVRVADTGPGIPAEIRSRIFDPYFTTKPTGAGTGVGLSVCLGIVEAHAGTLTVDCAAQGGTVFTVTLPSAVPEGAAASEPAESPIYARRRILVIDDEQDVRETLGDILTIAKHDVQLCSSGREALVLLSRQDFDVIVSDLRMPDLDGIALYRQIEMQWPQLTARIVFATGDTLSAANRRFLAGVRRPVIEKPFMPVDVLRVVDEVGATSGA